MQIESSLRWLLIVASSKNSENFIGKVTSITLGLNLHPKIEALLFCGKILAKCIRHVVNVKALCQNNF